MKWPRKQIICGRRYHTRYPVCIADPDGEMCWGVLHYAAGDIAIARGHGRADMAFETLIHEMMHAIFTQHEWIGGALRRGVSGEAFVRTLATEVASALVLSKTVTLPPLPKRT